MENPRVSVLLRNLGQGYDHKSWHGPILKGSLRGLSAEQAAWRPSPSRHNIWEIAVHTAYWKYSVLHLIFGVAHHDIYHAGQIPTPQTVIPGTIGGFSSFLCPDSISSCKQLDGQGSPVMRNLWCFLGAVLSFLPRIVLSSIFVLGAVVTTGAAAGQTSIISELPPPDPQAFGFYGWSAALSQDGNTALVGAQAQGRAYVFVRTGGVWTLDSRLPPASPGTAGFGLSVALSADGTVALVSNPDEFCPIPAGLRCGAAFVFVRQSGAWVQEARLGPTMAFDVDANFGFSAALSADGSTALVGQLLANCSGGICRGKVAAFRRNAGTWTSEGDLLAANPSVRSFGAAVALSPDGSTALIGAPLTICPAAGCGSAYIFTRSGGAWSEQSELTASDPQTLVFFGTSVGLAADGTSALIGAPGDSSEFEQSSGAVYAFAQSGGAWMEQQKIPGGVKGDGFGQVVSLSPNGQTALAGAGGTDCTSSDDNCGAVYRLARQESSWNPTQEMLDFASGDFGGYSVALSEDGRTGLIGAIGTACAAGASCGTAYVINALPAPEPGIPTASHLGLALLVLLLAASGAWVLARRRQF